MIVNSDITLYNSYYDRDTDSTKYNRTYIRGVNFQYTKSTKLSEAKGLLSADSAKIYIPFTADTQGKKYVKPKAYKRLGATERNNYFTFNDDDKVVKGIIDFELTGIKPHNVKYLEEYYDDVFNVFSVSTRDFGSPNMHHWEVGAK